MLREPRAQFSPLKQAPAPDWKAERNERLRRAERATVTGKCALCPWQTRGRAKDVIAQQVAHREQEHGIDLKKRGAPGGGVRLTAAQSAARRHLNRSAEREG
jgi:hypothetical protein